MKKTLSLLAALCFFIALSAIEYSKAGFYTVKNSGRDVVNFNLGWRFLKAPALNAHMVNFDDSNWDVVNCPHGLEYNSAEASGSVNYQGEAWYRKHFFIPPTLQDKVLKLHFEAVMGKAKVYLNGELIGEHFGGYLPFSVNLNEHLRPKGENVLAVWADNSDDPTIPPGKPQTGLDFAYFGGIYRDVWLVATQQTYITNPNTENKVAGGGIFVSMQKVSEDEAILRVDVDVKNKEIQNTKRYASLLLIDKDGKQVANAHQKLSLKAGKEGQVSTLLRVANPKLWAPWSPVLYRLEVRLSDTQGNAIDGVAIRVGIRKIEFRGRDGLYLNNKPYPGKLMGANRHQDHGYVGYAMPNNSQWRDAKILKNAACDIVRAAHYPADPAFMDACDELGIFFIVATPGWQFWNHEDPIFEQRVYNDIRNMVRRDRNHPSVILWEPVLNETLNPDEFAINAQHVVKEEYPYPGAYTACDKYVGGNKVYDVIYAHAENDLSDFNRSIFQREYGSVSSANTPNRMHRDWGEQALKFQVEQYEESSFNKGSMKLINSLPPQFVGGALWHSFDHFAGKHARPFYGGFMDVFRQAKYSYQFFKSQRDTSATVKPMVYLAHELSPFSPTDVNVFTNCEEVRLTVDDGTRIYQQIARKDFKEKSQYRKRTWDHPEQTRRFDDATENAVPHPIVKFKGAYDYATSFKHYTLPNGKQAKSGMLVEGLINGKVVASQYKRPAINGKKIVLTVHDQGLPLTANGSDFVLVMAHVEDKNGTLVRFQENTIKCTIEGEGAIIGDESISANPIRMEWGTAPFLVRASSHAGKIKIKAELLHPGPNTIQGGELELESLASHQTFLQQEMGVVK